MIENKEKDSTRALVIPKWLPISTSINIKDYDSFDKLLISVDAKSKYNLELAFKEFKSNPNPSFACDLLGSSIVLKNIDIAREVAKYLITCKGIPQLTIDLANRIILNTLDDISRYYMDSDFRSLRKWLREYPKDPIYWISLARLHAINGNLENAQKAILVAVNLAPIDRYIVRACFRYFVNIEDYDKAFYYVNRASKLINDPWIKATEISAAILNNMKLAKIKKLNPRIDFDMDSYYYSELHESIGALEVQFGNNKIAKKHFKTAWKRPNDNVISHAEWVLEKFPNMQENSSIDFSKSCEAAAWKYYFGCNLKQALVNVRDWQLQEPYSPSPFILGSCIASNYKKFSESIRMGIDGLRANKNDLALKNNLAYAYLKNNQINEADKILREYPTEDQLSNEQRIFYNATKGLMEFKKNNILDGRSLYLKAIELSKGIKANQLIIKASLNLAVAELEARTPIALETARRALELSENYDTPDIKYIRIQIDELLKRRGK